MKVLCVCLGNICRSPAAEAVLKALHPDWDVDSAGVSAWHVGEPPYGPMQKAALARGFDLSARRARQIERADFTKFDLVLALDRPVFEACLELSDAQNTHIFRADGGDVPDPYYTRDFDGCLDIIEHHAALILPDHGGS